MTVKEWCKSDLFEQGYKMLKQIQVEERNEHYTPFSAFEAINEIIPKDKIIWEPFTRGNHLHIRSPKYLRTLGCKEVIATGEDFFSHNYGEVVVSIHHLIL